MRKRIALSFVAALAFQMVHASQEAKNNRTMVTLLFGKRKKPLDIPSSYIPLCKSFEMAHFEKGQAIELPEISFKIGKLIIKQLKHIAILTKRDNFYAKASLWDNIDELDSPTYLSLLRAAHCLNIPLLTSLMIENLEERSIEDFSPAHIGSLPFDLRAAVLEATLSRELKNDSRDYSLKSAKNTSLLAEIPTLNMNQAAAIWLILHKRAHALADACSLADEIHAMLRDTKKRVSL